MGILGAVNEFLRQQGLIGEGMGQKRSLEGFSGILVKCFGTAFSLFFLYTTYFGLISQETHVGFYFLGTFVLSFLRFGARSRSPQTRISAVDALFILGMIVVIAYYIVEYPSLADRMGGAIRPIDVVIGWFVILLSLANVFPAECARRYRAFVDGRLEDAEQLSRQLVELNSNVSGTFGLAGVKAAMDLPGFTGGVPRRPYKGLTPEERQGLKKALVQSGLLRG